MSWNINIRAYLKYYICLCLLTYPLDISLDTINCIVFVVIATIMATEVKK